MKKNSVTHILQKIIKIQALLILMTCCLAMGKLSAASRGSTPLKASKSAASSGAEAMFPPYENRVKDSFHRHVNKKMNRIQRLEKRIMKKLDTSRAGPGGKFLLMTVLMMVFLLLGAATFEVPLLGPLMLILSVVCFLLAIRFFIDWIVYL